MEDEFLGYLDKWEKSVKDRSGGFSPKEKEKMMISRPTRLGLRLTGIFINFVGYMLTTRLVIL